MIPWRKLTQSVDQPVAIAPLIVFRILFGALIAISTLRFMALGWVGEHYVRPVFHFKYYGFSWIEVLPEFWMYVVHVILILAAVAVMFGLYYRAAAIILFITFTYLELIDLTYYLNHYYFVTIVSAIMIFLPANRRFSVDIRRKPALYAITVPTWTILLLQFQLAVVYTYAGFAKINYDWLILALPMKIWLPAKSDMPVVGSFFALAWVPYVFSWIGMLYDCTIAIWLSIPRTRMMAYISVLIFHVLTGILFEIGVFPIVMIAATVIFFSWKTHERILSYLEIKFATFSGKDYDNERRREDNSLRSVGTSVAMKAMLITFVAFQILFPLRFIFYPGNLAWTEQGYRFSWRVMLMEKAGTATFYVLNGKTGKAGVVDNHEFLNSYQENQLSVEPDLIVQYAHFLNTYYEEKGIDVVEVTAEVFVTLNGRPSQRLLDPSVNLAAASDDLRPKDWILPYKE